MTTLKCLAAFIALSVASVSCMALEGNGFYDYGPFGNDSALVQAANPAVTIDTETPFFFYGKPYNHICVSLQCNQVMIFTDVTLPVPSHVMTVT